jgi:hypothetical protein
MTNPSRPASKGRLAFSGSSLRVVIAFMAENPAKVIGVIVASVPPAMQRSVSPLWMARKASPMAWALDAHADTVA